MTDSRSNAEARRLEDKAANWKRWGPYLSERQWGTVREDYSADGDCWNSFTHDQSRSRAYRWGEDGLLGITDDQGRLCFALALWNGNDPILKERLFGLTGPEGNHGEDVKEEYFYLDSTPTHSYMKALYKYPQAEFPYAKLVEESRRRSRAEREFELADTGVFNQGRYFDVQVEYAKAGPDDILIRITATNRGPDAAPLHILPTLWFRNTWSWGCGPGCEDGCGVMPVISAEDQSLVASHPGMGAFRLDTIADRTATPAALLFTDNVTNSYRLWGIPSESPHTKDAFHERVIHDRLEAVNPLNRGTKAAAWFEGTIPAGKSRVIRLRLALDTAKPTKLTQQQFDQLFTERLSEADAFYASKGHDRLAPEERNVARQAAAGLLWSKQFYFYSVKPWLAGDPDQPAPPASRHQGRNADWQHLDNRDIISMPDKWEYPWYAAWDLAFHTLPLAKLDPEFAKDQLVLLLREWYMHPSGQIPAYEFAFGDVNPPVHAWAVWRVYKMTGQRGSRDRVFLARCFQKLLLNFTWWVNRKDPSGRHLFAGGFLGLDNIGVFDRSRPLPTGGHLEQADGTAWMAFFCGTMLSIALELARDDEAYEDIATKFFEHFIAITDAMNTLGGSGLWNQTDGFYYDQLCVEGQTIPLRVRSLVGMVPLLAVEILESDTIDKLPGFKQRMEWFLNHRKDLPWHETCACAHGGVSGTHRLLAIPSEDRLERVVQFLMDESEFLSPFGVRSVSKHHQTHPYIFNHAGMEHRVDYVPGESDTALFGGNSNWRGPIWLPLNFLLIEALERYHHFYGSNFSVESPRGSGTRITLQEAADQIRQRLARLFLPDAQGKRPFATDHPVFNTDPAWKDLVLFHEHFHADTGRGLGATHQTGWTALIMLLLGTSRDTHTDSAAHTHDHRAEPKPARESQSFSEKGVKSVSRS